MALKKKTEKRETPDDSIHVRLDNPTVIRKDVLAVAIDVIGLLKRYYEYIEIKKQKDDIMRLLRADINEIKRLSKELDVEEMPVTVSQLLNAKVIERHDKVELKAKVNALKVDEERREEKRKEEIKVVKGQIPPKASKLAIKQQPRDKLEDELAELRNMISRL